MRLAYHPAKVEPVAYPSPTHESPAGVPKCKSELTYEDRENLVCPECAHEWSAVEVAAAPAEEGRVVRDSNGNVLQDGDSVIVIKDLRSKARPRC